MSKIPLYKQIQQDIRDKIVSGILRPKDLIASEQEISETFKVSKITAKNALIGLADEGLVTRIQGKGTFVAAGPFHSDTTKPVVTPPLQSNNIIGLIIPTMKTRVIQKLLDYLEYFSKEAGYQLILHITRESLTEESRSIKELIQAGVKGIIVFPTEDEKYNESLLRLSLDKFPFVFIDRYLRNIDTYRITSDNFNGAFEAASYLLNKGHRQIALISPENANTAIEDRTSGFEKAFIDNNVLIDKNLWCHVPLDILRTEQVIQYITDFLTARPHIEVAFTLTAEMANLTFRSNQDLELISFDDPEIPNVPFIQQNEIQMAKTAVKLLKLQIDGEYAPEQEVIPVNLVTFE
ncbi:HTH-type transcriptional repressor PurR [Paenibacillus allorhizoplanae]|uniref:HTH-type transcriptional repressor PurR n=1 Tax=Paenibacillus allorhizoplanae TaxID=2905648 RepID=A0ABN8GNY6_9BACL|nr:GntR family transcriptional regulator [Paenibacillus allorhizoplanae]CAH1208031.1 HTH-type transcriptional repressor PurR [Paenibacillus allorhizoplanae]